MSEELKTDYCIIGGGIAGVILASKLSSSGKKILILDQGPRYSEEDRANKLRQSKIDLNDYADYNDDLDADFLTPHSFAKKEGLVVEWANYWRLFGIGGSALHFEAIAMRPREEDLKVKTLYGYGRDWPITYSELEPWLLKAEYEIGVSGNEDNPYTSYRSGPFPMAPHPFSYFEKNTFGPALKKLGMTGHSSPRAINSTVYNGRSGCQACRVCKFCPSGARYSPDRVHVPFLDKQSNVTILPNISLRRLETDSKGDKIIAAHATRMKEKTPITIQAKQFIVAMGGLETTRMLMLSADQGKHKNGLGNHGGQLGIGFSDHTSPSITYDMGQPVGSRLGFETMLCDHFRAHKNRKEQPTFEFYASPAMDFFRIGNEAVDWTSNDKSLNLDAIHETLPRMVTLTCMTELEGKGTVELDNENLDAFGDPVAKVTLPMTEWDLRGPAKLCEVANELAEVMGAKNVSAITPPEEGLGYHPSGATAMANNPDNGVCDPNLKVFGLENLYIVSNSVFPHMGSNPPTLTITALAIRLASHFEGRTA